MCNAGMGVHIFPLLIKLLIEGRVNSSCVHVVPSWDDEIASVPEAKLPYGFCNLLLVVMPRTPISDGNKVNIIMTGELNLSMLKFEGKVILINDHPTWLSVHLPTLPPYREEELTRNGEMVKSKKIIGLAMMLIEKTLMQRNLLPKFILKILIIIFTQFCWISGSSHSAQTMRMLISQFVFHICVDTPAFSEIHDF